MTEPHVEGRATHDDPESCAVTREGAGEALTGALAGWVLSREKSLEGADAVETFGRRPRSAGVYLAMTVHTTQVRGLSEMAVGAKGPKG